jgi:hypothetical protein
MRSPRHFLTIVGTTAFIVVAIVGLVGSVSAVSSIFNFDFNGQYLLVLLTS